MTEFIMPHMPSPNASLLFSFQHLVYHQTHGIYHATYIGGGAILLVGGGGGGGGYSGETKIAEGIKDAKNRRFLLCIAFAAKSGGLQPSQPPVSAIHDIWITYFLFISTITLCEIAFSFKYFVYHQIYHICPIRQLLITQNSISRSSGA